MRDPADMPISSRAYIVAEDGSLRRIPQRVLQGLIVGNDALLDYAGTKQKVADVVIENQDGKPVRILDIRGSYFEFDANGKIDEALRETAGEWMDYVMSRSGTKKQRGVVVDLVPELKKKDLHDRHRWPITKDLIDLIVADIWPGIHGPAPDVSVVKGKAPKKPALSYEAKDALREIGTQVDLIRYRLSTLSEASLKGFEFEARRTASYEDAALWEGVANQAAHQRAIAMAYRTGRGEWVAIVRAFRQTTPTVEEMVAVEEVKCASRDEAIEAARRLAADKAAQWVGADVRVEVSICSALEWREGD